MGVVWLWKLLTKSSLVANQTASRADVGLTRIGSLLFGGYPEDIGCS